MAITFPQEIPWPVATHGSRWLVFAYDWDHVLVSENTTAFVSGELSLCAEYTPCTLQVIGEPGAVVGVSGNGQIVCLSSAGCSKILIQSLAFECSDTSKTLFVMQGTILDLSNVTVRDCKSDTDGGVVQAYNLAEVFIESCSFANILSSGFGGAIAAYGSNLSVSDSLFQNCSSHNGGGAIWSAAFQGCYGSTETQNTQLFISSSLFKMCSTRGAGGAVLAGSGAMTGLLEVTISSTLYFMCTATMEGGGLRFAGTSVSVQVQNTELESCESDASGGAISSSDSSLSLIECKLHNNIAKGMGGGALQLNRSYFSAFNNSIRNNRAPGGGGGAILWQAWVRPAAIQCPDGAGSAQSECAFDLTNPHTCRIGSCFPCAIGSFRALTDGPVCSPCKAGSFSDTIGLSACWGCPTGKFSSLTGASTLSECGDCQAGAYSAEPGSSSCKNCPAGTFSKFKAANSSSVCISCPAGKFSSLEGGDSSSVCIECDAGRYLNVPGSSSCKRCPAGTYSPTLAANSSIVCRQCVSGTYSPIDGANSSSVCLSCDRGKYSDSPGSSSCKSCPSSTCSSFGANSSEACTPCKSGRRSRKGAYSPLNHGEELVYEGSITSCTLEQKKILDLLASVSIESVYELGRFLSLLSVQTRASSSREAVQFILKSKSLSTYRNQNIKTRQATNSDFPNHQRRNLRGAVGISLRKTQAEGGLPATSDVNESVLSGLCGANNTALYGPCIATDYWKLLVSGPSDNVYTGIPFNFTATKLDAYGSTIVSDSSSNLQASFSQPGTQLTGALILSDSLAGSTMVDGVASFQIAVQAFFSKVDLAKQSASLFAPTFLQIESKSVDSQSGLIMKSALKPINIQEGFRVCPEGYILTLSNDRLVNVSAVCTFCGAGTYSINPFAHTPGSSSMFPECIECPYVGDCTSGGADVNFEIGTWSPIDGIFLLTSCPTGLQVINTTSFTSQGIFSNEMQQCACFPGYEPVNNVTCERCPANYYCPAGYYGNLPCPPNSYSPPGSNSSSSCLPVIFVDVSAELPIDSNNFTIDKKVGFQAALALTAGVSFDLVVLIDFQPNTRRATAQAQLQVVSEIAVLADNVASANNIGQRVNLNSLNSNLKQQGLPMCTSVFVTVGGIPIESSSSGNSLIDALGGSVGGFVFILVCCLLVRLLIKRYRNGRVLSSFRTAIREAREGQEVSAEILPPDELKGALGLRVQYIPEIALGKGTRGCVIRAKNKSSTTDADESTKENSILSSVAIKIILPRKHVFDEVERIRLEREAELLDLVRRRQCRSAVQVVEAASLPRRADVCWFIMEVLGLTAAADKHIGEVGCVQLARDVLATLKVIHSEGWVHCDIMPSNILRCLTPKNCYEYKLIDFGSAMQRDVLYQGTDGQVATGAAAYRAPEMFNRPFQVTAAADIWSLGITLFELSTGCLPFMANSNSDADWAAAIAGNMEHRAPKALYRLSSADRQPQTIDSNLTNVIAKALEKKYYSRSLFVLGPILYRTIALVVCAA